MSKIALSPPASGTATFSITTPSGTSTDRTLTLPDTTAPILAGSGITLSASAPANTRVTTDAGNVGIGTSSPTTFAGGKFTVSGAQPQMVAAGTSGQGGQLVILSNGATAASTGLVIGQGYASASDNVSYISNQANADMIFRTNATERMRIDSSGNLLFNSGYGSAAVAYGCRAWASVDTRNPRVIYGSGNFSSITRNGTGNMTFTFATAMPDANYAITTGVWDDGLSATGGTIARVLASSGSAFQVFTQDPDSTLRDNFRLQVSVTR